MKLKTFSQKVCALQGLESWCTLELHGNANVEGRRVGGGNAGKVKEEEREKRLRVRDCDGDLSGNRRVRKR